MAPRDRQPDESELFREAMGDVEPLDQDRPPPHRRRPAPVPLQLPSGDEAEAEFADLQIDTPNFLEFRRPGIQHRVYQDLQRGVIEPAASLDLHGMRVAEARAALARFLTQSLNAQRRCVRVVHGKGRSSATPPILKQKVNQWLRQPDAVLAFCSAPRWDGGTGAVYVLLSRKTRREP
jgi:DNA-nicking Smr family endonuclease